MKRVEEHTVDSYFLSESREKELWNNSIFIFDTSALLDLYDYSDTSKNKIFGTIFSKITDRLWIPQHVEYEYLKNRESTFRKPISEKYKPLEKECLVAIEKEINSIKNKIKNFQNKTRDHDIHPYIADKISDEFAVKCEEFEQQFKEFEFKAKQEIEQRIQEIELIEQRDILLEAIKQYFTVGEEFKFFQIMEIIAEGELRYRQHIPPGYGDYEDKEGIQKFADLIIWKQIIKYAQEVRKPIILIINNIAKKDWCYLESENKKRIERPLDDLIREIKDEAGVEFWMYTLQQFLYKAQEQLDVKLDKEILDEADKIEELEDEFAPTIFPVLRFESGEYDTEINAHNWQYRELVENAFLTAMQMYPPLTRLNSKGLLWKFDYQLINYEVQKIRDKYKAFASVQFTWE